MGLWHWFSALRRCGGIICIPGGAEDSGDPTVKAYGGVWVTRQMRAWPGSVEIKGGTMGLLGDF